MIYFFELIHPITQPKIENELPKKVIPSPMSLVTSKKIPPTLIKISPILIGYCGFNLNSFSIA